ncbi:MAG: hypothetical protein M1820_002298 [Bogoriella megaspora]|nr:MAG: hypothetical protein M1820_002298 [Bogoriella megaspora]
MDKSYESSSLLGETSSSDGGRSEECYTLEPKKVRGVSSSNLVLLGLLVLTMSGVGLLSTRLWRLENVLEKSYSPANSIFSYERHKLWDGDSRYTGNPSPELDSAWEDLLADDRTLELKYDMNEGQNIRVTQEEMIEGGENFTNAVQLLDGGYLGILAVYHHLHCLDIIRRFAHPEYYTEVTTSEAHVWTAGHFDHCIERLRRAIMCHADLGLFSVEWVGDSSQGAEGKNLRSNAHSICVNWEALDAWARNRALEKGKFLLRAGPFEHGHAADDSHVR